MAMKPLRLCAVPLAALILLALTGCSLTRPVKEWLSPGERYRLAAAVCSGPEEVLGEEGVFLGLELTVTQLGDSCEEGSRRAFVSAGEDSALRKARKLSLHQQIVLVGTLEGRDRQTFMVERLRLR